MNYTNPPSDDMNRRDFLKRSAKAGFSIFAAGTAAYLLRKGYLARKPADSAPIEGLGDYSIATQGKMGIVTGQDRVKTVNKAIQAIGGIETYIKKGDRVLLKVNSAFASPPSFSATSDPLLVGEIARLCFAAGAVAVIVTDNPINDPTSCFELNEIGPAAHSVGAKLLLPRENLFSPVTVPGGRIITNWPVLRGAFDGISKVIGIAPVKDHYRGGASMCMKNWYGLLGGGRNRLHQEIHSTIAELAVMLRPTFVILDGTTTMMRNGPTGGSQDDLKATNTMIASTDQVAADAFGATLLGRSIGDLPYIKMAQAAGAGTADWKSLNPVKFDTA